MANNSQPPPPDSLRDDQSHTAIKTQDPEMHVLAIRGT
uniref:Uncharacterized protein n=1 Tax=Anguilla anguilla TaxID=7936 RepID=A0A0E9PU90_ANGAN